MSLPDEDQKRFIAILSKKMDAGRTLNVLGHLSAGLSHLVNQQGTEYIDYYDADGNCHPSLSHFPFIVLKADNSNKIRKVREEAIRHKIAFTDFTHTMTEGGSIAQQAWTKETPESELEYLGICLFGDTETLKSFTGKFSLYR
ncbi:DUF2000 domain-containing protein [Photobacterium sp. Hal280]|uniref:DUF2000 domain-containing protein n=1 Tax=Photobacterium sp. Hal280 TaxID=3035163 RepID=UPI00301DF4AE